MSDIALSIKDLFGAREGNRGIALFIVIPIIISSVSAIALGLFALAIPVIILLIYLFLKYEIFPIYFFVISIPLVTLLLNSIYTKYSFAVSILIIITWLARKLLHKNGRINYSGSILTFFIVFMTITLMSSIHNGFYLREAMFLVRLIIFILLILALYDYYRPEHIFWLFFSTAIPLIIVAAALLMKYLAARNLIGWVELYRAKGGDFGINVNAFAMGVVIALCFWLALAIWHPAKKIRNISTLLAAVLSFCLFLTGARASILGFIFTVGLYSYWRKKVKYIIFAVIAVIVVVVSSPVIRTVLSVAFRSDTNVSGRDVIWKNSLDMIKNNIWLGVGVGNYHRSYFRYIDSKYWHYELIPPSAHNQILDFMAELGIAGLPLVLFLFYLPAKCARRALKVVTNPADRSVIYGLCGVIVALYIRWIFEGGGMLIRAIPYPAILYWVVLFALLKAIETKGLKESSIFFPTQ